MEIQLDMLTYDISNGHCLLRFILSIRTILDCLKNRIATYNLAARKAVLYDSIPGPPKFSVRGGIELGSPFEISSALYNTLSSFVTAGLKWFYRMVQEDHQWTYSLHD
ncbi:hypothetical protein AURANDRAFT_67006 [Aureococcus anophagefferens]|uniref:Uncharacterized protein n=1 Tax=Aureococcus anophagefferens TaxID=44056 RepID=F0YJK7_AURAN|nr:hypothetical protein AURANDRAFT_67006 [Aureococcus anophagefferens]EGB04670.1 hypothetical protein AURANDRAFT_67006 [Aureococcus anophagefferens]|eukprot:XP_009040584.1 hypothetical protein AURANDRAFT_67006 [Aureococcus anophagefferens]